MKALFSVLMLMGISSQLHAQDYVPTLQEGRYWSIAGYDSSALCTYVSAARSSYVGDTLIDGLSYGKFINQDIISEGPMFCGPYSVESESQEGVIYLHEDPVAQQIYAYNSFDSAQFLLYDFSLNVGDTLFTSMFGDDIEAELVGLSLQTFEDGVERQAFEFQGWFGQVFYYEGIGGENGLFTPFNVGIGFGSRLWCHGDESQIIHSPVNCPDIVDGIDEAQQGRLNIYPTVSNNWVNLEIVNSAYREDLKIEVLDVQGKSVNGLVDIDYYALGARLNVGNLVSGLYNVVVRIDDEQIVKRIIKTD
jgi:hypothetical protein